MNGKWLWLNKCLWGYTNRRIDMRQLKSISLHWTEHAGSSVSVQWRDETKDHTKYKYGYREISDKTSWPFETWIRSKEFLCLGTALSFEVDDMQSLLTRLLSAVAKTIFIGSVIKRRGMLKGCHTFGIVLMWLVKTFFSLQKVFSLNLLLFN